MATAKKTPVKTAAKAAKPSFPTPAPVKKEKAPVVKPLKVGDRVQVTRRNNEVVTGKVTEVVDKPNGRWITTNVSTDKKRSDLVTARVSQVKRV